MNTFFKIVALLRSIFKLGIKFPNFINRGVDLDKKVKIDRSCKINYPVEKKFNKIGAVTLQAGSILGAENQIETGRNGIINIGKNVTIGKNNLFIANDNSKITIGANTTIGDNNIISAQSKSIIEFKNSVKIKNNCKIKAGGDSKYLLQDNSEVLEDSRIISPTSGGGDFTLGNSSIVHMNNFLDLSGSITIKDNARTSRDVKIHTHIHGIKGKELIWNQPIETKSVSIGHGAWVGTGAQLLPGAELNTGSILGAGGILTCQTKKYRVYGGIPAKQIKNRLEFVS